MSLLKFYSGVRMTSPFDLGAATDAPFWGNCSGNFTEEIWIQQYDATFYTIILLPLPVGFLVVFTSSYIGLLLMRLV